MTSEPTRFCLHCGYPVDHLAAASCPECGRPFDLSDPASFTRWRQRHRFRRWIALLSRWPGFHLVLVWAAVAFPPTARLALPAVLLVCFAGLLAVGRRWRWLVVLLALSPVAPALVWAGADYATGQGKWRGQPPTRIEDHNPDRVHRVPPATDGGSILGRDWLMRRTYNLGLVTASTLFGLMPGTYDGPYPTKQQAKRLIEARGRPISADALTWDRLELPDATYQLASGLGRKLLGRTNWAMSLGNERELQMQRQTTGPLEAAVANRVLVLWVPLRQRFVASSATGQPGCLILIDRRVGRPFAYYNVGPFIGFYNPPPVTYQKK
jgi:hypothetical protein